MYPALLEGRFCILHETKYLSVFHFLKSRTETNTQTPTPTPPPQKKTQNQMRVHERNTFYCLLTSKNRYILLE